jgi:hypothetical protein
MAWCGDVANGRAGRLFAHLCAYDIAPVRAPTRADVNTGAASA